MARIVLDMDDKKLIGTKRSLRLALALAAPLIIVGCSSVPDALNPAEWYRDTMDAISSDDDEAPVQAQQAEAKSGAESGSGSSEQTTVKEQERIQEGLVADRDQGRYSDEDLTRQGEAMSPLKPETPQVAAKVQPVQNAAPTSAAAPMAPQQAQAAPVSQPQSLQEVYRNALAQKLPYATSNRAPMPSAPVGQMPQQVATASMPYKGGSMETVIISSSGVHSGGAFNARFLDQAPTGTLSANIIPTAITQDGANPLSAFNVNGASQSYKIATIQFGVGSANLSGNDQSILRKVASLQKKRGGTIRVVGHASSRTRNMDKVRHDTVNLTTSTQRADKVAKMLMRLGVAPTTLYVGAVSDTDPVYYEVMPSGEAGNRRAEVYIDF
ncbi:MAG: OmpA family protein [Rhodospirillales bacterium]|nr:OmpA family protein [Rhodospirillales bacterium]